MPPRPRPAPRPTWAPGRPVTGPGQRTVSVPVERVAGWVDRFVARHPGTVGRREGAILALHAPDGARAVLRPVLPAVPGAEPAVAEGAEPAVAEGVEPAAQPVVELAAQLTAELAAPRRVLALIVRRGGFGCAVLAGRQVVRATAGRRHVQGRTAAGGWSQQRFARRRDNQAQELVRACADRAATVLVPALPADALVTGGDRALVARVLSDPRLREVAALPQGRHLAVGDPRAADLHRLPDLVVAVQIEVEDPQAAPAR